MPAVCRSFPSIIHLLDLAFRQCAMVAECVFLLSILRFSLRWLTTSRTLAAVVARRITGSIPTVKMVKRKLFLVFGHECRL